MGQNRNHLPNLVPMTIDICMFGSRDGDREIGIEGFSSYKYSTAQVERFNIFQVVTCQMSAGPLPRPPGLLQCKPMSGEMRRQVLIENELDIYVAMIRTICT